MVSWYARQLTPGPVTRALRAGPLLPVSLLVLATVLASAGVATVVPEIGRDLSLRSASSAWVLSVYQVGFALAAAMSGQLCDRWGLSRAISVGVGLFAVGALLAGGAWVYPQLVLGRFVEGLGGGSLAIISQLLITASPDEELRRRSLRGFTAVVTACSAAGPLMGGAAGEATGWRILMMLPALSVLAVPVLRSSASATVPPNATLGVSAAVAPQRHFGAAGAMTLLLAVGALMLATRIPTLGADPIPAWIAVAGMSGTAGVLAIRLVRQKAGFIPLELIRDRMFLTVCAVGAAVFGTYFSLLFAVPILLSGGWHWSPLEVGTGLLPASCLGIVGSWCGAHTRIQKMPRAAMTVACVGAGLGAVIPAVTEEPWSLILALGAASAALGTGYVLALNAISRQTPASLKGTALGLFNVCFYLAGAVISTVIGLLLEIAASSWALLAIAVVSLLGAAAAGTWKPQR
jgi:MFS transporter, DHA2 family, metal-tetracycline-proton antiporter